MKGISASKINKLINVWHTTSKSKISNMETFFIHAILMKNLENNVYITVLS